MAGQGSGGNVLAAICSIFIAGLGQLVQGRIIAAIFFCVCVYVGYAMWILVFPPIISLLIHVWCIIDAAKFRGDV